MEGKESKAAELPARLVLYFDGLCEPRNPGGWSTYGWHVCTEAGEPVQSGHGVAARKGEAHSTNNHAEYSALGFGLRWLTDQGWRGEFLEVRGDSRLVVNQVNGSWACNKEHLRKLRERCLQFLEELADDWRACWIPREENTVCDALSRKAYEAVAGEPPPERPRKGKS